MRVFLDGKAFPVAPTLVEFLSARIAEDDLWASSGFDEGVAIDEDDAWDGGLYTWVSPASESYGCGVRTARIARECEAKRRIVADHKLFDDDTCVMCQWQDERGCPTLRHLAAVYADHPDYRQEWKP